MQYKNIEGLNKPVSKIVFGSTNLDKYDEQAKEILDGVVALGITSIDTARVYTNGKSEKVLGQWMEERGNREKVMILTKGAHPNLITHRKRVSRRDILSDMEKSLEALRTDYVDIYLLHRDNPAVEVGTIMETMQELVESGKAKVIGASNWSIDRLTEANEYATSHGLTPFGVSSVHFGLAEQYTDLWGDGITITGERNASNRGWYEANQMPLFAYSSLGNGFMSGRFKSDDLKSAKEVIAPFMQKAYFGEGNFKRLAKCEELAAKKGCSVSQIALAWLLNQKINTFALVSSKSVNRMKENMEALEIELSAEELKDLYDWTTDNEGC